MVTSLACVCVCYVCVLVYVHMCARAPTYVCYMYECMSCVLYVYVLMYVHMHECEGMRERKKAHMGVCHILNIWLTEL